jgi:2-hydroxycyclohexanecarboxyl-CoA dehydrogenase
MADSVPGVSGRTALVTGGGGGIGRAIVFALAEAGCAVAVGDLREDTGAQVAGEVESSGGHALALVLDVTDAGSVERAFRATQSELGAVDVLVNCAGWDEFRAFADTDEAFWRRVIAINYEGVLRTTQAALGGMAERGRGRIVNISSDAARVGSAQESIYAGAKARPIRHCSPRWPGRTASASSLRSSVPCRCDDWAVLRRWRPPSPSLPPSRPPT